MSTFELPGRHRRAGARAAGQYTRQVALRLRMRSLLTLGLFAVFTAAIGRAVGLHDPVFEGAEVALLCVCFAVSRWVLPVVERFDRGASAEEYVGSLLGGLAHDGWRVIHDAEIGRGNVDHIIVGPAGLFTVETKSNPGPIRVQRLHGRVIAQVHQQRERVEQVAGARVEPLLVYSRAPVDHPGRRRKGVRVLEAPMLLDYLSRRSPRLTPERVDELHARLLSALDAAGG